ncbi:hypothetical protein JTB14_012491 [Gonioctena quinquepunctata]|nr:hypothetical protein JTB14_012491 [Gonioctena quinquepunctata]
MVETPGVGRRRARGHRPAMSNPPPKSGRVATAAFDGKQRRAKARGVTTLMYAAQQGDVDSVKEIIQVQKSSLFSKDRTGKTSLHYCCTSDNIRASQAADLMVMAAPDLVDSKDEDGFTPLHLAVIAGNMQLVTFLLANNADVNAVDNEKHTVAHWATVCGETAALRAVLASGAPVSTPDVHGGYPLHYAAQMCGGDRDSSLGLQVLQTLLSHSDIVVSVTDGDKRQPLLWAASAGSARAVLALIRAGANVEAADKDGLTALHCAASRGHTDCMDTLLTLCGASIDVIDSNGCTALHYAVTLGHADATALLLAHGADPNRQDRKGRSPAHCGCAKGQFETVKLIGSHGANLWLRNARGDLPLHDAAASGRRELVKWLLEMRPSHVNARNNDGRCPLHMAALNDNADMCKILLDAGAQINPVLRTSKNVFMTPLDCALQRGFRSTAKFLQLHGGVPATRLGDPRIQPMNSALNLQIRDDTTLWGGSSSDSERENGEVSHSGRKMLKKKMSYKHGRRKMTLSGSDQESSKNKQDNSSTKEMPGGKDTEKKLSAKQETVVSSVRSGTRKMSSSRLDYTNEIIINGKTEINIRQHEEIVIGEEYPPVVATDTAQSAVSAKAKERDRRPRSAKYSKVRDKSGKRMDEKPRRTLIDGTTSPETVIQQEESRKISLKDQSTNTSEDTTETVIENKKFAAVQTTIGDGEVSKRDREGSALLDQQSIMSFTSEDAEEQKKELVVEASVHPPPRCLETSEKQKEQTPEGVTENDVEPASKTEEITPHASVATLAERQTEKIPEDEDRQKVEQQKDAESEDTQKPLQEQEGNTPSLETDILPRQEVTVVDGMKNGENAQTDLEEKGKELIEIRTREEADGLDHTEGVFGEKVDEFISEPTTIAEKEEYDVTKEKTGLDQKQKEYPFDGKVSETELTDASLKDIKKDDVTIDGKEDLVEKQDQEDLEKSQVISGKLSEELIESKEVNMEDGVEGDIFVGNDDHDIGKLEDDNVDKPSADIIESKEKLKRTSRREQRKTQTKGETAPEEQQSESLSDEGATLISEKTHKSFRILDEKEANKLDKSKQKRQKSRKSPTGVKKVQKTKAVSEERKKNQHSKIPTPLFNSTLSKSDRHLNEAKRDPNYDIRVPSLPNISDGKHEPTRCESNMSAPLQKLAYSDNERGSFSEGDEQLQVTKSKRRVKKRSKTRESRSAGSDYESSNLIDSGFEPSPRSTRIPRWKNMSERGVNMTSVTQNIQSNIRRYHLERKIFQQLLELKRHQIRAGQHNEAVLVKRAIDTYHQSCASTVGAGRYIAEDYTFKSFEKFLYEALRKLQKNGAEYLRGLPETDSNPLLCTRSTNKCMHATHAYTGVPCAAYLPKMDHHSIPKIGFNSVNCKPGSGFLPTINPKKSVTLELSHGTDKQVISLPTDRLDQNKRYYVTFTVKGHEAPPSEDGSNSISNIAHRHSKSD